MTIRNRLTLQFTTLVGIILLLVFAAIYLLSLRITRNEFFDRLRERTTIAENIYFEKDELTKSIYEQFEEKFLSKLPDEMVQVFDEKNNLLHIEGVQISVETKNAPVYSAKRITEIRNKGTFPFSMGDTGRVHFSYRPFIIQVNGEYYHDNQGDFVIFVSAVDLYGSQRLAKLLGALVITYILTLLVIFFAGRFYARNSLRPITNVVHKVQKISASNLHLRVDLEKNQDEITELSVTFNDMLTRLEAAFEQQKIFVSNASHELRTPLTSIIGELEVFLTKARNAEEYREALQSVLNDAQQLNDLITGLLTIAQIGFDASEVNREEVRIDEVLVDVQQEIERQHSHSKIILNYDKLPDDESKLILLGNKQLLCIAFSNLLSNAVKFSNNSPVQCNLKYENGKIEVRVVDKGIGIAEDEIERIFQPFYRSHQARNYGGHGIGLALVQKIMELHHGKISVSSEVGKGTEVMIFF